VLTGALDWRPQDSLPVLLLSLAIVCYPISYYLPRTFRPWLQRRGVAGRTLEIQSIVFERLFGAFMLGVPALVAVMVWLPPGPRRYGFNLEGMWVSLAAVAISCGLVWAVLTYTARRWPAGFKGYPQIRLRCWDTRLLALNTLSWCIYLVAHEFLFRSVLLFPLAEIYGTWPAVMITTGLYSFKHLVREPQEQLITIWVGIWFGGLAIATGSLLAPILTHCFTASFMDFAAIRTVPGGQYCRKCPPDAS
jgi:membrane protease YdiL (CAAX protease family)